MKNILTILLFITASKAFSQHTIFPKKGLAIQCEIKKITLDSIYFTADNEKNTLKCLPLKRVIHYSFNLPEGDSVGTDIMANIYDTTEIKQAKNGLNGDDFKKISETNWSLINKSGSSIKKAVIFNALSWLIIGGNAIYFTSSNLPNSNIVITLGVAALGLNLAGMIEIYQAGAFLELVSDKR
jgi:hypothetical protein